MGKPTLDLDLLVRGTRTAEESAGQPIYVVTFGSYTNLRTQDRAAAQAVMAGLVGFDEVTVTIRAFGSLEELDYHERFEKKPYEEQKAFENDWRRWMDYEKREEAREIRQRIDEQPRQPPGTPAPAERKKGDDVPL